MGLLVKAVEMKPSSFDLTGVAQMLKDTAEMLQGAPSMKPLTFKCPSGGGKVFACDDDEMPPVSELEGIIISARYVNVYWSKPMGEGSGEPDCLSEDGLTGYKVAEGEVIECDCRICPFNKMGSAPKGKGKACKNKVELLMLIEGQALPVRVSVPTMSVANYSRFATRELIPKGLKPWQVSTKIALKTESNAGGTKYSQMVFGCTGRVDDGQMNALMREVAPLLMGERVPMLEGEAK